MRINLFFEPQKKRKVLLHGGLGNQLFQIAEALRDFTTSSALVVRHLPQDGERTGETLDAFVLPTRVLVTDLTAPIWIIRKAINLGIRISTRAQPSKRHSILRIWLVALLCKLIGLIKRQTISFNLGVGKDSSRKSNKAELNIGYFQFQPEPKILKELAEITLRDPSTRFLEILEKSNKSKFIAVHVRLGDYLTDQNIGTLSSSYYNSAISQLLNSDSFEAVYVFSNDVLEAKRIIHLETRSHLVFVGEDLLSSAETFELMRHASAYVISNSTFSWWASMLSYTENPIVICPTPWFKRLPEPVGLIPADWIRNSRD